MRKTKFHSISKKVSLLVFLMILVSSLAVGLFGLFFHYSGAVESNALRAQSIAESVASGIDATQFEYIMETKEENEYWQFVTDTLDLTKLKTEALFLYILDKDYDDNVYYFSEGMVEADNTERLMLGEEEEVSVHDDELFEAIKTGRSHTTGIYDSEGFGMVVSGYAPILDGGGRVVGVVGVDIPVEKVYEEVQSFGVRLFLVMMIFCILFSLIAARMMRRLIGDPIGKLEEASNKLAAGDLDIETDIKSNDEIGRLAKSFNEMVVSTKKQAKILEAVSSGDLRADAPPRSDKDVMGYSILRTMNSLNHIVKEVHMSAQQLSSGSDQIASGSQNLARGTAEQSAAVKSLEESIGRIADKISDNEDRADKAAKLAGDIENIAHKGSKQMADMVDAVQGIDEANRSIDRVMHAIEDISFQTNILALNAAVEAARAGQHGKGFAVVAEEVRSLAAKSAASAKESAAIIENSIKKTALGVSIAGETSESLKEIVSGVRESGMIISEIADASTQQSRAIEDINANIHQVVSAVQQNSAMAEESAAASEEVSCQSDLLESLLAHFKLKEDEEIYLKSRSKNNEMMSKY